MERYREFGCKMLRTDQNGAIMVMSDGETLEVKTYRNPMF
jgi:beta-lactamase superfamily II metal-dependent hydrolase